MAYELGAEDASQEGKILSPFANTHASLPGSGKGTHRWWLLALASMLLLLIGAVGGVLAINYLNDPFRTLEPFPVGKYFENHRTLAGLRFRGDLRVEADLGWNEGKGRLMVFSSQQDPRPIAVMVPSQFKEIYFTKGQSYVAELEVGEGGLIYANAFKKN
jgi:hypothetical protein